MLVFYLLCLAILAVHNLTDKPLSEQQGLVCIHLKCYGDNHFHIIDMRRIFIFKFDVLRMLEVFLHTLFPNALDGILHCCPCYIQQLSNLPNCHPHLTMMWGVDDHIFLYCYHLSFHTLPFIVLVLSLQTFPNVNSSMLLIC